MKKIDDKKIKGISIELDRSTKLNELDDTINEFREKTLTLQKLELKKFIIMRKVNIFLEFIFIMKMAR